MTLLQLKKTWTLSGRIGGGGFGQVFSASAADGEIGAVKLVPKTPGADREMLFVNLGAVRNVVPVIDQGETKDSWAIVMPRADYSLEDYLKRAGRLGSAEVRTVLVDVMSALADLDGRVVHRDIKPANILFLNGRWCLADFGISRYAEASTAPDTQKYALSPPYAAPERWRLEHATGATDVYSLGVVAYELLEGRVPFPGPTIEDYRDQHLHKEAPALTAGPIALRALIGECMFRAPGARPSPQNLLIRVGRISDDLGLPGLAKLREANASSVARQSEEDRRRSEQRSRDEQRKELFRAAVTSGEAIRTGVLEAILDAAPTAKPSNGVRGGMALTMGQAQLEVCPISAVQRNPWDWDPPAFDVVASSAIIIRIPIDQYGYVGRAHSLWYCDAQEECRFNWYETAFMWSPLSRNSSQMAPFLLDPGQEAAKAFGNGMAEFQLAWPFVRLETDQLGEFIDRWAGWLAQASEGMLGRPRAMPELEIPRNWRRK